MSSEPRFGGAINSLNPNLSAQSMIIKLTWFSDGEVMEVLLS